MRKSYPSYSLLTLSGLIFAGSCSIIAEVDRTKIPQDTNPPSDGGQGQGGTRGGSGGSGGSGATPTGGTAGDGGMGGEPTAGMGGTGGDAGGGTGGDSGAGMGGAGEAGGGAGGAPATCGDGDIEGNEECDDGDTPANDDGCSTTCQQEDGWECTGTPSTCVTECGDGIEAGNEACDDGNALMCGTCNAACSADTPSAAASGTITLGASAPMDIDDGDYFTLNDGVNTPPTDFEFDVTPGDGVQLSGAVPIVFDPSADATALQAAIITAINTVTTTLRIQASAGTGTNINLANEIFGSIGNQTSGDNVMETSFTISPMTGGAAHDCPIGTGCTVNADCANGACLSTGLCN